MENERIVKKKKNTSHLYLLRGNKSFINARLIASFFFDVLLLAAIVIVSNRFWNVWKIIVWDNVLFRVVTRYA